MVNEKDLLIVHNSFFLQYIPSVGDNVLGIVVDSRSDVSTLGQPFFSSNFFFLTFFAIIMCTT